MCATKTKPEVAKSNEDEPSRKSEILSTTPKPSDDSPSPSPKGTDGEPSTPQQQPPQQTMEIDDSDAVAAYSNFCRVSSTPEELILDLGLNPQPLSPTNGKVKVTQRVIMNHFTAKRLLAALSAALQRHEQAFGVLETDIRKRLKQ